MIYETITKQILHKMGISKKYIGFDYIVSSIVLISENENILHELNKVLYVDIAKLYNTTPYSVERNIRYAIHKAWSTSNNNSYIMRIIFGDCLKCSRISNKLFLELLYEYIRQYNNFKSLFSTNYMCPILDCKCEIYDRIIDHLLEL